MKTLALSLLVTIISCMNMNQVTSGSSESVPDKYKEMTVLKHEKCESLLMDNSNQKYEVQHIKSKIPSLSSGKKIWITFQPLRRMTECGAQPIEV